MHRLLFSILANIILILNSCSQQEKSYEHNSSEFEFIIQGKVDYAEGLELCLYIPSQGLDQRSRTTVKNGEYRFTGKTTFIEECQIRFEENIAAESSTYSFLPLVVEPGLTELNFTIEGDSLQRYTQNWDIRQGDNNKYYDEVALLLDKAGGSITITSDPIRLDSLQRNVYPRIKKNRMRVYDSIFSDLKYPEIAISVLNGMVEEKGPFQFDKLTEDEVERIIMFFDRIDVPHKGLPEYREMKNKVEKLRNIESIDAFTDFILTDINANDVKLSEVISSNDYTLLYFWWKGCVPCRKFNRETSPGIYRNLKRNKIEMISIAVDESREHWKKASLEDSISWINLYAGAVSDVELAYNIEFFPTKIIFDNNFDRIDFEFMEAEDLIKLLGDDD